MLAINNNPVATMAANNLLFTYGKLQKSINNLSSGLRINSAADDAAGLAVREIFRAEVASLRQGIRNVNDAISMLQTMDGAAAVIDEKLIRLKELAEQAATGTYSSAQRKIMQAEFDAMRQEIDRIAQSTQFNTIKLLASASHPALQYPDGIPALADHDEIVGVGSAGVKIHFGPNNNPGEDYYGIQSKDMTSAGLGIRNLDISEQQGAQFALSALTGAIIRKDMARAHFGAMQNRLENTARQLTIQAENLSAAESRISDIDVAMEMTNFLNLQIKTQAAVAMLSQANMLPQLAMQLLGA